MFNIRSTPFLLATFMSTLLYTLTAEAEKRYLDRIEVWLLDSTCADAPKTVYVLFDDNRNAYPAVRNDTRRVWIFEGHWEIEVNDRHHASVRFEHSRTDCRTGQLSLDRDDPSKRVATFTFARCEKDEIYDVTLAATDPFTQVSYRRFLPGMQGGDNVDCGEEADYFANHSQRFESVWLTVEALRLKLGNVRFGVGPGTMFPNVEEIRRYGKEMRDDLHLSRESIARFRHEKRLSSDSVSGLHGGSTSIDNDLVNLPKLDLSVKK